MAVVNLLIPAYQYPTTGALWADLTAAKAKIRGRQHLAGPGPRRRSAITRRSSARRRRPG